MEPELRQQYNAMINNVVNDNKEQAQAVLSNILAAKMASKLSAHNEQIMTLNRTSMATATAKATPEATPTPAE
jgi:hypothetical protein